MFCSKHVDVKQHSVCFPEIEKTFAVSSLVLNLFASQIGEFFLLHPVHVSCIFYHLYCNQQMHNCIITVYITTVSLCRLHSCMFWHFRVIIRESQPMPRWVTYVLQIGTEIVITQQGNGCNSLMTRKCWNMQENRSYRETVVLYTFMWQLCFCWL